MKLEGVNRRFGDRDVLKDVNLNFDKNGMVFYTRCFRFGQKYTA